MPIDPSPLTIRVSETETVSALLTVPQRARAAFVLAHGAGAGMTHPFITSLAHGLAERDVATMRFQFPYMQRGSRRPDSPPLARATVRAAVAEAGRRLPDIPLFAGGKSFGGRMTSQAQAESPLSTVRGVIFVGFPLHPAGKPSCDRADHLSAVRCPMLFLQGTRDELARLDLITAVAQQLGARATLKVFADADHSFHVRASSGSTDGEVQRAMVDTIAEWMAACC